MKPIIHKIMFNHVLNFGFIQRIVFEIHDPIADDETFKVDIFWHIRITIVDDNSDSDIRDVFARITLTSKLKY